MQTIKATKSSLCKLALDYMDLPKMKEVTFAKLTCPRAYWLQWRPDNEIYFMVACGRIFLRVMSDNCSCTYYPSIERLDKPGMINDALGRRVINVSTGRMTVHELAKELGKSPIWVTDELRRDSKREVKQWPFAISTESESGRWSYVINRRQFEKWNSGDYGIDYVRLADMVAAKVIEHLKGA